MEEGAPIVTISFGETRTFRHLKAAQIDVWRPAIQAGGGRLVGGQLDAIRARHPNRKRKHHRVDVNAVGDEADGDPLVRQQSSRQSWLAVMERRHGVEEMGAEPDACVEAGGRLGHRRTGVPRRHVDVCGGQLPDRVEEVRDEGGVA